MCVHRHAVLLVNVHVSTLCMSEIQNSKSQLIILSSDAQLSKPWPIAAGDHSHVTALAGWRGRQVRMEADLSHFEGKQEETHFLLGGTGVIFVL